MWVYIMRSLQEGDAIEFSHRFFSIYSIRLFNKVIINQSLKSSWEDLKMNILRRHHTI